MAFEIGFLVGSLLLLAAVLYVTRIRNPAVPRARTVHRDAEHQGVQAGEARTCDVCGSESVSRTTGDLALCRECDDDLLS